jgi:antitoxin (DNA-binding transcriptional repressor) of toxin-antitoxin stability system
MMTKANGAGTMREVSIEDLKSDPEAWVACAEAGETLIVLRAGRAIALMMPVSPPSSEPR